MLLVVCPDDANVIIQMQPDHVISSFNAFYVNLLCIISLRCRQVKQHYVFVYA